MGVGGGGWVGFISGRLINGCFFFTGSWPITKGDYKQQFTILMSVYNHTV